MSERVVPLSPDLRLPLDAQVGFIARHGGGRPIVTSHPAFAGSAAAAQRQRHT
ncbi:hypothetical protein NF699_02670 [Sphingomonadaceae bacterium OTU29LAMAA1]|nr:hypothetical protein NF699_02670 [Sphingomonadaceae bacterium OTU29LAMAA1]